MENSNIPGLDKVYQFLFFVLAVFFHCLAFLQFQTSQHPSYADFYHWEYQFFFLIAVSFLCSVLAVLVNNAAARVFFLLFQFLAVQILSIPLGNNLQIEVTLLLNILFFTGSLFAFPANGLLCFFQVALSVGLQKVKYVFEVHLPETPLSDIIAFTLVLAFAGFLSCVYGIQKIRINNQKKRIVYLKSALSKISQINIGFQKYAVQAGRKTIVTERKRLSREIHDSIGYILTNILMMVKTSILLVPPESSLKELLTKISLHAEEGIVEIRSTLHELRNQKFSSEHGIMAITKLVKVFSDATGIKVDIEFRRVTVRLSTTVLLPVFKRGVSRNHENPENTF